MPKSPEPRLCGRDSVCKERTAESLNLNRRKNLNRILRKKTHEEEEDDKPKEKIGRYVLFFRKNVRQPDAEAVRTVQAPKENFTHRLNRKNWRLLKRVKEEFIMTIQELMEKRGRNSGTRQKISLTPNAVMTAILFPKMTKRPILQWKIVLLPSAEKLTV